MRVVIPPRTGLTLVAVGVGIVVALWMLAKVWQVFLIITIALILAGTLSPLVDWLEKHGAKRGIALLTVLLLLLFVVIGFGFLVIPALVSEGKQLMKDAPQIQQRAADYVARVPALANRASDIRDAQPNQFLAPLGGSALSYAQSAFALIAYGVTTIALAFYLIADRERVRGFLYALIPRPYHVRTARLMLALETIVGGYMRGQALTSALIGGFTYVLLLVLHVPNALILAILAGFADLIPYIGPVLATAAPVLFALSKGVPVALIVLVALVLYEELESRLIIPRVYGKTLRLSPVAVTIALLMGGKLFGIIGALLALPIAAAIRATVEELRIALPGEQSGEPEEQAHEERIEARYLAETEGATAVEAANVATTLADELEEAREQATGEVEIPVEQQRA
ncbi:MAG: AI-2E family transporter [Thermomicrobiales bacterium]